MKCNALLTLMACFLYLWSAQQQTGFPLLEFFTVSLILAEFLSRRRVTKFLEEMQSTI